MKADLAQIIKSTGLKHQIYKTISGSKFSNIGHLIKNSAKKKAKYVDFKSQGTQNGLQTAETKLKSNRSVKKLHSPGKDTSFSNKKYSKQSSKQKLSNIQRSDRRCKATSSTQINKRSQNYLLDNSQKSSKSKQKKAKESFKTTIISNIIKNNSEQILQDEKCNTSLKSKSKTSCKINLQSILEQSSSQEHLITPDNKKLKKIFTKIHQVEQKTTKKQKRQAIPEDIRKKIAKSFTNPQKFIRLGKNQHISASFRILKKKLIQIQIYTLRPISLLKITLEKGNLQCQSIQQTYKDVGANTVLALFSSVRDINIMDPYNYPEIHLQISQNSEQQLLSRYLILPYTFLHLSQQREQIISKKSRIKTKLCIEKVPINAKKLSLLSQIFKVWSKKQLKGQSQFQTHFALSEQEFKLKLIGQNETFTLELQGRGEQKLNKLLDFLEKLIC